MPRKSKYEKDGFTNCNCGECNFNMYMHKVFSMDIDFFCVEDAGFMTGWTLYASDGHTIKGETVEDFIECLNDLKKKYNFQVTIGYMFYHLVITLKMYGKLIMVKIQMI